MHAPCRHHDEPSPWLVSPPAGARPDCLSVCLPAVVVVACGCVSLYLSVWWCRLSVSVDPCVRATFQPRLVYHYLSPFLWACLLMVLGSLAWSLAYMHPHPFGR